MSITIRNDFHNTEITMHPRNGCLSARQMARAKRALCGIDRCQCSGDAGERGRQVGGWTMEPNTDGSARIVYPR